MRERKGFAEPHVLDKTGRDRCHGWCTAAPLLRFGNAQAASQDLMGVIAEEPNRQGENRQSREIAVDHHLDAFGSGKTPLREIGLDAQVIPNWQDIFGKAKVTVAHLSMITGIATPAEVVLPA